MVVEAVRGYPAIEHVHGARPAPRHTQALGIRAGKCWEHPIARRIETANAAWERHYSLGLIRSFSPVIRFAYDYTVARGQVLIASRTAEVQVSGPGAAIPLRPWHDIRSFSARGGTL